MYSESIQTSKTEVFVKTVNGWYQLPVFAKCAILDVDYDLNAPLKYVRYFRWPRYSPRFFGKFYWLDLIESQKIVEPNGKRAGFAS